MKNQLGSKCKGRAVALFKAIFHNLREVTEKKYDRTQSRNLVSGPSFEICISCIRNMIATRSTATFRVADLFKRNSSKCINYVGPQ